MGNVESISAAHLNSKMFAAEHLDLCFDLPSGFFAVPLFCNESDILFRGLFRVFRFVLGHYIMAFVKSFFRCWDSELLRIRRRHFYLIYQFKNPIDSNDV
jgi:hypothetical protein